MKHEIQMPAGVYYIGDLAYVMGDKWNEAVDLMFPDAHGPSVDGKHTLTDGTEFVIFSTAYGDGAYQGTNGEEYGVDSGSIGCIDVTKITDPDVLHDDHKLAELGSVETFDLPWIAFCDGNGDMSFNGIRINTAYEEDYDESDDDYTEDDSDEDNFFGNVDTMDGDHDSAMESVGWGTDEDYGYYGGDD